MKSAEFESAKKSFVARLQKEAKKPSEEQEWPEDDWMTIPAQVVCHTPGCPSSEKVFEVTLAVNADALFRVSCGKCGKEVDDVIGVFDDGKIALDTPGKAMGRKR